MPSRVIVLSYFPMIRAAIYCSSFVLPAILCCGNIAQAQVGLTPLVLELQAERGQAQAVISIDNVSDQTFRARVYPQPFTYHPEQGFQTLTASPNDLAPYLQFSPRELAVPPKTSRLVRVFVRFPPSLPDGEYRTAIFTENLTETPFINTEGVKIQVGTRVGTAVYVRKGAVSANLVVENARFKGQHNQIQLFIKNTGQASARPQMSWTLKQGETVVTQGTLPATTIIAGSQRLLGLEYSAANQPRLSPGTYQLTGQLSWGGEESNQNRLPFTLSVIVPTQPVGGLP